MSAGPWDQPRLRLRLDDRPRDVWMHRLDPVGEQAASEMDRRRRRRRPPSPPLDSSVPIKQQKATKSKKAPLPKTAGAPLIFSSEGEDQ